MQTSVIIINYNYSDYVGQAIESVLGQIRPAHQILVVDDGSTDDSLQVIRRYEGQVTILAQPNSGMMEAANHAFSICTGEFIIFLDADDYLYPNAIQAIETAWKPGLSKIQWRMDKVGPSGERIGSVPAESKTLPTGEVWKPIVYGGDFISPPTSGNAFAREVLARLLPFKAAVVGSSGTYFDRLPLDAYLKRKVPFFGDFLSLDAVLSAYRVHGRNGGIGKSPYRHPQKRRRILVLARLDIEFISEQLSRRGLHFDSRLLFVKNKMVLLRILSHRLDQVPPFPEDQPSTLAGLALFAFKASKGTWPYRIRNLAMQFMVLLAPSSLLKRRYHHP